MKVLIIGGGATGSILAHFLSLEKEIEAVVCGDINTRKAKRFLPNHPKITLQQIDATQKDKVALLAKGFDLLINASLSQFNKFLMDAALEAGTNYQDLASKWDNAKVEQLDFNDKFKNRITND